MTWKKHWTKIAIVLSVVLVAAIVVLRSWPSLWVTIPHPNDASMAQAARTAGGPNLARLIQDTGNLDWKVRWDAVNELGKLKDRRGVPALVRRALYDDNPHPRWRSLWALKAADAKGSEAVPLLRTALEDPDPVVVRNAAIALAFFGQPEARDELLKGLADDDSYRRWEAIFSLRRIGNREVAQALIPLLQGDTEPEEKIRREVVLALGYMGSREVVSPLLDALREDKSPQVRWRAAMTLSKVGDSSVIPNLKRAMSMEKDSLVREHIEKALTKIRR
jgi:HEAT repeat protein